MGTTPEMSRGRSENVPSAVCYIGIGGFEARGDVSVDSEGRGKLPALRNLSTELDKKGFGSADLLPPRVKPDGSAMHLAKLLSREFDLKQELVIARVKVLDKTDRI